MAEEIKQATLQPAEATSFGLLPLAKAIIKDTHPRLSNARIRFFWAMGRPLTFWGRIKVASEESWWLSGGLEDGGADVILQVNMDLWGELEREGREFLVDYFLDQVRPKEAGQTEMETVEGRRQLYERQEDTLRLNPVVLARHPRGLAQIAELARLQKAFSTPEQFALDFQRAVESEAGQQGTPKGPRRVSTPPPAAVDVTQEPPRPALCYYELAMMSTFGPVGLRFTSADRRPETLTGVHFFPDAETARGIELDTLTYEAEAERLLVVRLEIERERAEWVAGSIAPAVDVAAVV